MSKKILYIASTFIHIKHFHLPYLEKLTALNYDVHVLACGDSALIPNTYKTHCVDFQKSMFSFKNLKTAFAIAKIIEAEKIDIVYVHTSLAAFFTRLGVFLSKHKPKLVINMVHGYLFDNKSPFLKRIIMLLAEKITKPMTDVLMVMNHEDYEIATKHQLCKGNIHFINGVGLDFSKFPLKERNKCSELRKTFKYSDKDFLLVYTAEFSKRKNQYFLIQVINQLKSEGYPVRLLLLGNGTLMENCKQEVFRLALNDSVIFVGYTPDTAKYYCLSDICVSSSRSEGLPFNIMEAMASGLPVIATKVKGHTDLVIHGENGYLFNFNNQEECVSYVKALFNDRKLRTQFSEKSIQFIQPYSLETVKPQIIEIIETEYKSRTI